MVSNGRTIKFWYDWWLKDKPLELDDRIIIPEVRTLESVSNFILPNKQWDTSFLESLLPAKIIQDIRGNPITYEEDIPDTPSWSFSGKAFFC